MEFAEAARHLLALEELIPKMKAELAALRGLDVGCLTENALDQEVFDAANDALDNLQSDASEILRCLSDPDRGEGDDDFPDEYDDDDDDGNGATCEHCANGTRHS